MNKASDSTFGIIGLAVTYSLGHNLAKTYGVDSLSAGLLSLSGYVLLTPLLDADGSIGFPTKILWYLGSFCWYYCSTCIYRNFPVVCT